MHIIPARPEQFEKEKDDEYQDNVFNNINESTKMKITFFRIYVTTQSQSQTYGLHRARAQDIKRVDTKT
jgi:hypothetical protein